MWAPSLDLVMLLKIVGLVDIILWVCYFLLYYISYIVSACMFYIPNFLLSLLYYMLYNNILLYVIENKILIYHT